MKRSLLLLLCAWSGALVANPVELKDREGRVITAEILKLEGDELVIQRADKQLFRLSLEALPRLAGVGQAKPRHRDRLVVGGGGHARLRQAHERRPDDRARPEF